MLDQQPPYQMLLPSPPPQHTDLLRAELANQPQLMEPCMGKKRRAQGQRHPGAGEKERASERQIQRQPPDRPPVGVEQVQGWREGVRYVLWIQPPQGKDCTPVVDSLVSFVWKVLLKLITPCSAKTITGATLR